MEEGVAMREELVGKMVEKAEGKVESQEARLVEMVVVEMGVPEGVNKIASFQTADLRHHVGQESVGCDVKRHA